MTPMEEVILEELRGSGPCSLDDVVTFLPHLNWGEVFVAVNRLSRDIPFFSGAIRFLSNGQPFG